MKRIGIIGGGIVGSTAGYYLSREGYSVDLYDLGTGQATKAAAGIINPWFSLRRNKPWYFLVAQGAEFYHQFIQDLTADGFPADQIFQVDGAIMVRRTDKRQTKDLKMADSKRTASPSIGEVKAISASGCFSLLDTDLPATWVAGGGRVDGSRLIQILHQAIRQAGGQLISEQANLSIQSSEKTPLINDTHYDAILLSPGAWLPQLLEPLNYHVDIQPQKGQLYTLFNAEWKNQHWPVVMPPGTGDIIPFNDGRIIIGATHEDDKGYDLAIDLNELEMLREELKNISTILSSYSIEETSVKVGTRAHTSDYSVLVGGVPDLTNTWAISGLGSSGLTSGPYLGYQWSQLIQKGEWHIQPSDFPIENYIYK